MKRFKKLYKPLLCILLACMGLTGLRAQKLKSIEYFFDKDPGIGKADSVALGKKSLPVDSTFTFDVSGLTNGLHFLYVRAKDTSGHWGLVYGSAFIKTNGTLPANGISLLSKLEYFFDKDPGVGKGQQLNIHSSATADSTFSLNVTPLTNGLHVVYFRAEDEEQHWSIYTSSSFIKTNGNNNTLSINKIEYFINSDPGFGKAIDVPVNHAASVNINFNASITDTAQSKNYFCVRAQDNLGNWSLVYDTVITKVSAPHAAGSLAGQNISGVNKLAIYLEQPADISIVELQKSADGLVFNKLSGVAAGPVIDNSYNYDDRQANGKNYYRLQVTGLDGTVSFSKAVLLDNTNGLTANVYPNPVHNNLSVQINNAAAGKYAVAIFDMQGRKLQVSSFTSQGGQQVLNLPVAAYAKGIYIVEITDNNGNKITTQKVLKQ